MRKLTARVKGFILYDLGLLERRFYWKTKKYLKKYYNKHNEKPIIHNKTIVYMLDGRAYSGGITDIIRGIISMYKFSKEIEFNFRINFCFPYRLNEYLEQNQYNWFISKDEISYNSDYSTPLWIYSTHLNYERSREFEMDFQKKILKRFIGRNDTKRQYHIYTNSEWAQGYEYSMLFNELFKPTNLLKKEIDFHKKNLGADYISMTFRFQQLLGDFVENETGIDKTTYILDLFKHSDDLYGKKIFDRSNKAGNCIFGQKR